MLDILRGGYRMRHSLESKVYVEHLLISQLVVTVSFLPAPWTDFRSRTARPGQNPDLGEQGCFLQPRSNFAVQHHAIHPGATLALLKLAFWAETHTSSGLWLLKGP